MSDDNDRITRPATHGGSAPSPEQAVAVIICAYDDRRWNDVLAAADSVARQTLPAAQTVIVVDHNPGLLARLTTRLPAVTVLANQGPRGASGARNTGAAASTAPWLAFMDDDTVAEPGWLEHLVARGRQEGVLGVGGSTTPLWPGRRPSWFPDEFAWVVGASYRGLPASGPVRNVWSCNMLVSREVFDSVGGFRVGFGKLGHSNAPEDTDFCLRARRAHPGREWMLEPLAEVGHRVPSVRAGFRYFLRRCYSEGRGKAELAGLLGSDEGTSSERRHARLLVTACGRELWDGLRGDRSGLGRSAAITLGLGLTLVGFSHGRITHAAAVDHTVEPDLARNPQREKEFHPTRVIEIDLAEPLPTIAEVDPDGTRYASAHVLVRFCDEPLGWVDVPMDAGDVTPRQLADAVWPATRSQVCQRVREIGLETPDTLPAQGIRLSTPTAFLAGRTALLAAAPMISVVLCTRGRAARLPGCLDSLERLRYPRFEIVVVDNAATDDSVPRIAARHGQLVPLRVVPEPRPGLAIARNTGVAAARGEIIAFVDDDEQPDPHWLTELLRGFHAAPDVAGVAGPMLPLTLDTPAQCLFEQFGGHNKGRTFDPEVFDRASHARQHPLYPLPPFGTGGNMAFTADVLRRIGGFDPCLGAGTCTHGAEDTAAIYQVMSGGGTFVYQPSAIVWHSHRSDLTQLTSQLRGYGVGLTAFYARTLAHDPRALVTMLRLVPRAWRDLHGPGGARTATMGDDYPPGLERAELAGIFTGPFAYAASRWQHRATPRSSPLRSDTSRGHR